VSDCQRTEPHATEVNTLQNRCSCQQQLYQWVFKYNTCIQGSTRDCLLAPCDGAGWLHFWLLICPDFAFIQQAAFRLSIALGPEALPVNGPDLASPMFFRPLPQVTTFSRALDPACIYGSSTRHSCRYAPRTSPSLTSTLMIPSPDT
jgi:hypothetical protein